MNAPDQLESNLARLRAILDTAVDGIITVDERGLIDSFNPAAERLFGCPASEAIGQNIKLFMPSPYREEHDSYIKSYLDTGEKKIIGIGREVVGQRKDGGTFPIQLAVSEVRLGDRRLFTGIVRDITQQKLATEQMQLLAEAMRNLEEGVVITDAQLESPGPKILFANEAMVRITGYQLAEMIGQTPRMFQGNRTNRAVLKRLKENLCAGHPVAEQLVNYRKDGSTYEVELLISAVTDEQRETTHYVSIHRDITRQKHAEERAVQAERLAAIGQMVTGLAHESRNALQRSQSCLELLALELEDQPEVLDLLARVQKAQDHLHHLYEEVRSYAAPIKLHQRPCDLGDIWRETWSHLEVMRKDKHVSLREETGGMDLCCHVDRHAISQVFRNILENAIVACPAPGEIVIECVESALDGAPAVRLALRDNGPGLDEQQKTRIFEPFFTTKTQGTGLGMAIASRIVESHGGEIGVGDCPSGGAEIGAEIIVTLPRGTP